MSAASPSSPSPKIDSMSNDALLEHLTPKQSRDLEREFYAELRELSFFEELRESLAPGQKKHPDKLAQMAYIGGFAGHIFKLCSERFIERLRDNATIDLPEEHEEYDLGERWER